MKKIKWHDVRLVLILGAVVFLYSFSSKRNETRKLTKADIEISGNENFITIDEVNNLLIQNLGQVNTIRKDRLNLNNVEKRINKNPMVEKAEIYTTVDGKLKAVVRQKNLLQGCLKETVLTMLIITGAGCR
ncbi:hypothetical protein [Flavobacterium sp. J372]|uniref:hypothetical protein n=1 Tax=Flavobacterium sp. J372 TaxID=2898436 RepID=UPI0027E37FE0|nr:hypothetical protein [Flavobacterium sp. J372]